MDLLPICRPFNRISPTITHHQEGGTMIKVLITRVYKNNMAHDAHYHNAKLRSLATVQPGYISGQTMVNVNNPNEMVIISTWAGKEDWDTWYQSDIRKDYYQKIRAVLEADEEIAFYSMAPAK